MATTPKPTPATELPSTGSNDTTPSAPARATVTQTARTLRKAGGAPRKRSAADLSEKFIDRVYQEFCEDPDTDRIAERLDIPRLTVIEAVSVCMIREIRKPVKRETQGFTARRAV